MDRQICGAGTRNMQIERAAAPGFLETGRSRVAPRPSFEKGIARKLKTVQLGLGYPTVIDDALVSQPGELLLQAGGFDTWKFRYRFHVDVERVEKQSAVGKIWTWFLWPIIKPGVQRIEPDAEAPRSAARSMSKTRSEKSPWPQLRSDRTP
jgi:hypothetical protein